MMQIRKPSILWLINNLCWLGFRAGTGRLRLYLHRRTVSISRHQFVSSVDVERLSWRYMIVWRPVPRIFEIKFRSFYRSYRF